MLKKITERFNYNDLIMHMRLSAKRFFCAEIKLSIIILLLSLVCFSDNALATAANIVKNDQSEVTLLAGDYSNNKVQLAINFKLLPNWHIYWREAGDTGFPPVFDWSKSGNINIEKSQILWPAPQRYKQELQPGNIAESYVYTKAVTFPVILTPIDNSKPVNIVLHVSYAICAELCIPAQADLSISLPPGYKSIEDLQVIELAKELVPQNNGESNLKIVSVEKGLFANTKQQFITVKATNKQNFSNKIDVFITAGENIAFTNPDITIKNNNAEFIVPVTFNSGKKDLSGEILTITLVDSNFAVEHKVAGNEIPISADKNFTTSKAYNINTLMLMLVFAFIGGLILNVMPCVLPVLTIKILGVIKQGGNSANSVSVSFLVTACGVIVTFVGFALITIWLKAAGKVVGFGYNFQEPYFIICLVIILTLLATNMWGMFTISLPAFLGNLGSKYKGLAEHFMTGVLATILATPCTAPFLGTAVGFSLSRGNLEILLVFTLMGLGLAFPYLFFSFFPGMVTKMPKPGAWMLQVKKIMSLLLLVAAIWLIWVISNQLGKFAATMLLLLCICIITIFKSNLGKVRLPLLIGIIILSCLIPVKFNDKKSIVDKYVNNEIWEDFTPQHIAALVANGKIVFVDITADWCLTCKVNKLLVLNNSDIKDIFSKKNIVAMQADWTNRDSRIADYLMQFERAGIPFNIVYGPNAPEGIVLSEILNKKDVLAAIAKAGADKNQH